MDRYAESREVVEEIMAGIPFEERWNRYGYQRHEAYQNSYEMFYTGGWDRVPHQEPTYKTLWRKCGGRISRKENIYTKNVGHLQIYYNSEELKNKGAIRVEGCGDTITFIYEAPEKKSDYRAGLACHLMVLFAHYLLENYKDLIYKLSIEM